MRRVPFLLTVALIAAAIGDPLVESIANTGLTGAGYADDNHAGVLPALLAGLLFLLGVIAARSAAAWCGRGTSRSDGAELTLSEALRLLPFVLLAQLALVFAIECCEGLMAGDAIPAGLSWLGGPLLLSLSVHAALALLCAAGCAAVVRWAVGSVVALISDAVHFIRLHAERSGGDAVRARREASPLHIAAPPVRQIGGRAPPHFPFVNAS